MMPSGKNIRPLHNITLGISASDNPQDHSHGFGTREVNRSIREVAQAILAQGGNLVFGHDWRSEGVMVDLLKFAMHYQLPPAHKDMRSPLMTNYVPWPSKTTATQADRDRYKNVLQIIEMDKPKKSLSISDPKKMEHDYIELIDRASALSEMRITLAKQVSAQLCFGGRISGSGGCCSGIAEEAMRTIQAKRPLYITKLFGGSAGQVIDAIDGHEIRKLEAFKPRKDVEQAFRYFDNQLELNVDFTVFKKIGIGGIAETNHLSVYDNRRLFHATHLGEVIGLVLKGLSATNVDL